MEENQQAGGSGLRPSVLDYASHPHATPDNGMDFSEEVDQSWASKNKSNSDIEAATCNTSQSFHRQPTTCPRMTPCYFLLHWSRRNCSNETYTMSPELLWPTSTQYSSSRNFRQAGQCKSWSWSFTDRPRAFFIPHAQVLSRSVLCRLYNRQDRV